MFDFLIIKLSYPVFSELLPALWGGVVHSMHAPNVRSFGRARYPAVPGTAII